MADLADAPAEARAVWADASDGLRLRVGLLAQGTRGTILLLQGRTEYLEKYGRAATELKARGYGMVSVDWRGQGRSDRLLDDPRIGHVDTFADYQKDLAVLTAFARASGCQQPWYVVAHSMGGAIGLRALTEDLDVAAAVFSAPLWGLTVPLGLRSILWAMSWTANTLGKDYWITPGMRGSYVVEADPHDNSLTGDPEMMAWMQKQLAAAPELALAGPSLTWVYRAMVECQILRRIADPRRPVLTFLPGEESVVLPRAIRELSERWPDAGLIEVPGARHEIMMETRPRRTAFFDDVAGFFAAHD
ncbi:MAG: alpha/beta hydrolase [Pseudomonadota bacterium]